jgi:hypothetical protein
VPLLVSLEAAPWCLAGRLCVPLLGLLLTVPPGVRMQEEIRFVLCPELVAGMFFLPAMADNEAIEIIGAERYSTYTG